MIESSERLARAEIERWPDGVYRGESWMVSDGIDPTARYRIAVEITIAGSEITFDFSETDDQAPGFTNMPPASALGAIRIAFLMLINAGGIDVPTNQGLFAPIKTVFREGSLLSPRFPASTIFGNQMCDEVVEAIMLALAEPLPDRVTAGWNQLLCTAQSALDPRTGEPSVSLSIFMRGGPGAMRGSDGFDALGFSGTPGSMRSPDMEMFELSTPHFMEYYEYLPDSAGAGRWRGGLGTTSSWRFYGEGELGVSIGDDAASEGADPAAGLFGGEPAGLNDLELHFPDGTMRALGLEGDRARHPRRHDLRRAQRRRRRLRRTRTSARRRRVMAEVRDGLVSVEKARASYGVAVLPDLSGIDEAETARLRGARP